MSLGIHEAEGASGPLLGLTQHVQGQLSVEVAAVLAHECPQPAQRGHRVKRRPVWGPRVSLGH